MGEIRAKIRLENLGDRLLCDAGKLPKRRVRVRVVDAVVDTGAMWTLLPQEIVESLGLKKLDRITVTLANDEMVRMDQYGPLNLFIGDRRMTTDCLMGPPGCEPLLGQLAMEGMDLVADPGKKTLTPRPESPYGPTFKMKRSLASV